MIDRCQRYYETTAKQSGIPCHATITGSSFANEDADLLGAAGLVIDRWFAPYLCRSIGKVVYYLEATARR